MRVNGKSVQVAMTDAGAFSGRLTEVAVLAGPLVGVRLSLSHNAWRIGPAWAALAGALAYDATPQLNGTMLLRLLGALVLVDLAWGLLWSAVVGATASGTGVETLRLPYAHPSAPLFRFLRALHPDHPGAGWHELGTGLTFAFGLAVVLGWMALALTALVVVSLIVVWAMLLNDRRPALVYALLNAGLPWLLGMSSMAGSWAAVAASPERAMTSLIIGVAFTVLQWGVLRSAMTLSEAPVWLGQAAALLLLVISRSAWPIAVVALLFLPPAWRFGTAKRSGLASALTASGPWWLAAMFFAAIVYQIGIVSGV